MESSLLLIFTFLSLALVTSHAALSSEEYWNSMLPNTPMPRVVKDLLQPDYLEDKSASVVAGKGKPGGTSVDVGKGGVDVDAGKGKPGGTSVGVGKGGVGVDAGKPGKGANVGVGKGGVSVHVDRNSLRNYRYAATETQLHDDPSVALFFLEKDMHDGTKMNWYGTKTTNGATFLPRAISENIPFSSNDYPEILNRFSVKPNSLEAEIMKTTIKQCEEPGIKGEEKYCATSLESMVDFSTSKLGKRLRAISNEVKKETQMQSYTIMAGVKRLKGDESVVCHKQNYPYAVFYCHSTHTTRAYVVPLKGADGTIAKALAICHTDTSKWNPKHLSFQVLKVKPGTVPVCHFLPQDDIVWVPY